jgi:hypothetical protein
MKVERIRFQSNPKETFFAPEWDYSLYEAFLDDINCKKLAKIILKKEKQIKNNFNDEVVSAYYGNSSKDGNTGLGLDSLTSRYPFFNVLTWKEKEIQKLKNKILEFYLSVLKETGAPRVNTWIKCWANVMRENQQIRPHIHSVYSNCYLGGHLIVQTSGSFTGYVPVANQINNPDIYKSINTPGKITIFPSNIPHFTSKYEDKHLERITIAFDIETSSYLKSHIPFDIIS